MKFFRLLLILTAFLILAIASSDSSEKSNQDSSKATTTETTSGSSNYESAESNNQSSNKPCVGNQGCISDVRSNFESTGKQILGEEYLGDGVFGISFLDARRGEAYNSKVYTDCNCQVIDVSVSTMR